MTTFNKVVTDTLWFFVLTLLATTLGETSAAPRPPGTEADQQGEGGQCHDRPALPE